MMHDMMGGGMMWAMGFIGLLIVLALVLVIGNLIKYFYEAGQCGASVVQLLR